jgi:hypothetical protein
MTGCRRPSKAAKGWISEHGASGCTPGIEIGPHSPMILPGSAKVLFVDRLADQYLVTVKVSENHRGKFDKLNFGKRSRTSALIGMVGSILPIIKIPT